MQNHGKIIFGLILALAIYANSLGQSYYLCTYDTPKSGSDINVIKVNLRTGIVMPIGSFPLGGDIEFRTPLVLERDQQTYLFVSAMAGLGGKNSETSNSMGTNYTVIDTLGNPIRTGTLAGYHLYGYLGRDSFGPIIKYSANVGEFRSKLRGFVSLLPNDSIEIVSLGIESQLENYPRVGPFESYNRIIYGNDRFHWAVTDSGFYLLALNLQSRTLINSVRISESLAYSYLFQISAHDSLLYVFHINYNQLGGKKVNKKLVIDPCYLIKYRYSDMTTIDSVAIRYPSIDSGYVSCEWGTCDWVGPYLVYYFFQGEDIGYFSPAMLFIFDTRTNETRWLRVGWR